MRVSTGSPPLALALALGSLSACHAEGEGPRARTLRSSFPSQAAAILDGTEPFVPTFEGLQASRVREAPLRAALPPRGGEAVRMDAPGAFSIAVLEDGAAGEPSLEGAAAAYARRDGVAFWRASARGYEEWLLLDPGRADGAGPVASWEIAGGALEQRGPAVEIVDGAGVPRVRVTAPRAYTASGRALGVRLDARGSRIELTLDGRAEGEAVLIDPEWTATALMTIARANHTATRMSDGRVLLAGGAADPTVLPVGVHDPAAFSAEIYDPASGVFTAAGTLPTPHAVHMAALLCDGRVLVAGGFSSDNSRSKTALIYDPAAHTWAAAAPMHYGHTYGTATALPAPDCRVLVAGGYDALNLSELYDPATGKWTAVASGLSQTRFYHTATRLDDGRVVVAGGGYDDMLVWTTLANVDVFDPVGGKWSLLSPLHDARRSHAAALLPDGRVLVTGGSNGGQDDGIQAAVELATAEIYDPHTKAWTLAPPLLQKRTAHTATVLDNGAVLLAGGVDDTGSALGTATAFRDGQFSSAPSMIHDRYLGTATLLDGGAVLVAGGQHQATAEVYRPDQDGALCSGPSGCESGFCVDGYCCDSACADACSRCDVPGAEGTCASPCVDPTHASACPGGGPCAAATCAPVSCSPFLCTASARGCASTCATVADCAPGFACDQDHRCVAPPGVGNDDPGACGLGTPAPGRGAAAALGLLLAATAATMRRRQRAHAV